ncbi:MAG: DUF1385 domain-containing protein [Pseudomonadota bacterium]
MSPPNVGGQAVIEGVMMKAPRRLCVAVRRPSGAVVVKNDPFEPLSARLPFLAWPFLRGPVVLGETLVHGLKALSFSANQALEEEDTEMGSWALTLTMALAVAFGLALFVAVPHLLSLWLGRLKALAFDEMSLMFHLTDGVIKVALFMGYLWLISRMKDIQRVFEYHGAEHKTIFCFEAGEELTVANARRYSRLHPRCGTAFLLVVLVVSMLVFAMVFPLLPKFSPSAVLNQLAQIGLKVLLMLPIAGISYEVIRLAGKKGGQGLWGALLWPGLQMQRLTTREPDDDQIEIALAALKAAVCTAEGDAPSLSCL